MTTTSHRLVLVLRATGKTVSRVARRPPRDVSHSATATARTGIRN